MREVKIPDWDYISEKRDMYGEEELDALEEFVYRFEPAGEEDESFRKLLKEAIEVEICNN